MKNKNEEEKWYLLVVDRIAHFIVGAVSFVCLAASIVLAYEINEYVKHLHVDGFALFILQVMEGVYAAFDAYVILRYIVRKIFNDYRDEDKEN